MVFAATTVKFFLIPFRSLHPNCLPSGLEEGWRQTFSRSLQEKLTTLSVLGKGSFKKIGKFLLGGAVQFHVDLSHFLFNFYNF